MRDHDSRAFQLSKRIGYDLLRDVVERACRLVKHKDSRFAGDCSRNEKALPLPAGNSALAFRDQGKHIHRHLPDIVGKAGHFGGLPRVVKRQPGIVDDMGAQSTQNHQGRGETLSMAEAEEVFNILKTDALKCYDDYEYMLNENPDGTKKDESRKGLARELARMNLPVNVYTQWYWKTDLHNLFHFLSLRAEAHAQKEIRDYANVILDMCRKWVPLATEAFEQHCLGGAHLSQKGLAFVRRLVKGEKVSREDSGLMKGEYNELMSALEIEE